MKKIGILTLYDNNNYGNRLQNYAVQKVLSQLDLKSETIINKTYDKKNRNLKYFIKIFSFRKLIEKMKKVYIKIFINNKYFNIIEERNKRFNEFNSKINFSKYEITNKTNLINIEKNYDYFCVGSDQVWNPYSTLVKDINFLLFSPKNKNIAFSASFGVSEIPEMFLDKYIDGLNNFKNISVREDVGKEIIEKISKNKAEVLIDPTMMLTKEEWLSVSKKIDSLPKRYMVLLFLGNISKKRKKLINKIRLDTNLDSVYLNKLEHNGYYDIGPSEFIDIINNSSLVITDSFHVAVFSILFHKPFYVLERDSATKSMNSRITTLLKKFGLEDRLLKEESRNVDLNIDFSNIDILIEKEREKSLNFLKKALDIKE